MARVIFSIFAYVASVSCALAMTMQEGTAQWTSQEMKKFQAERVVQRALMHSNHEMKKLEADVDEAVKTIRANMTLEKAVKLVSNRDDASPSLVSMIQELGHHKRQVRYNNQPSHFLGLVQHQKKPTGVDAAKQLLNEMLTEAMHNIDKTHLECKVNFNNQCMLMASTRQEIEALSASLAKANGDIITAETEITDIEQNILPELNGLLKKTQEDCKRKRAILEEEIRIVREDIETITSVLKLTDCAKTTKTSFVQTGSAQKPDTSLLKCDCNGTTTVKFQHPLLQQQVAKIKSQSLQRQVLGVLGKLAEEHEQLPGAGLDVPNTKVPPNPCEGLSYSDAALPSGGECTGSIASNPRCLELQEKFLEIQISLQDLHEEKLDELAQLNLDCERLIRSYKHDIGRQSTLLSQHQSELAYATQTVQRSTLAINMKQDEHKQFSEEMSHFRDGCTESLTTYEAERCQLDKIRSELFIKMNRANEAKFVDCEVGEWVSKGCTVECGGGTENLTRAVIEPPLNGGVVCPVLEEVQPCNVQACPVDCVEDVWSGWSSCSAECDGGIRLRSRAILTHPSSEGKKCEGVTETESCAMQSCEPDCVLFDWTEWSSCSKACDSGHKKRFRAEQTPAKGGGTCPDEMSSERYNEETCNVQSCPLFLEGSAPISCSKTADIVLVLDGSGSLGEDGFAKEKAFAKSFVSAFSNESTMISVLLFSGPVTWEDFYECTGDTETELTDAIQREKCGLFMEQRLTTKMTDAQSVIEALPFPAKTTFTSGALYMAKEELRFGRDPTIAEKIVVLLTDGVPIDTRYTKKAARTLKATGIRIVVVPLVGAGLDQSGVEVIEALASRSKEDNIVEVDAFEDMAKISTVDALIEDVCGLSVGFPSLIEEGQTRA